ncbi:class I SAM-dependent methyltransferase [Allopontixanthobacter sp.]|uniref:class I SAM-dependent methyltransferase n=1 Tax=Allopontixanthobacter sp. TaxID=2906452 RepID=UPI002AB8EBAD|nr:class I SAM-dependent methyltransferase [Allopontixanthobacter sp.]MDZ4306260.1 class I SAM-dependent methyltransferase [Allopontixanthobacter sp.]
MEPGEWEGPVGAKWAREWRRTDRSFAGLTDRLLGHARSEPVFSALDIGCGAGELSLALGRSHTHAEVLGIDISEDLIAAARSRAINSPNVRFEVADAAVWNSDEFTPDLLLSRHGVMFFPEPTAAFANLRQSAAPSARLIFSCFRSVDDNPWATGLTELLPAGLFQPPQSMVPGPFAFADKDAVTAMLVEAGWSDIEFEKVDFAYIAGTGEDAVADAKSYFLSIGPAARAAAGMAEGVRAAFSKRLDGFIESHLDGDLVALLAGAWIVTARASPST